MDSPPTLKEPIDASAAGAGSDGNDVSAAHDDLPGGPPQELLAAAYSELRAMAEAFLAGERDGHTLQATALVHEAYLKLATQGLNCGDRAHFFALAARAMRRILVDHARARNRLKRGGGAARTILLAEQAPATSGDEVDLEALEDAMVGLAADAPMSAQIVEMRYFAGLTETEIGQVLGVTDRTVRRHWTYAKAWLFRDLAQRRSRAFGLQSS